jgi:hypothetical protein
MKIVLGITYLTVLGLDSMVGHGDSHWSVHVKIVVPRSSPRPGKAPDTESINQRGGLNMTKKGICR